MKILSINAVKEFSRLSGKQHVLQTQKQSVPKMKEALCLAVKERSDFYLSYPKYYRSQPVYNIEQLRSTGKGAGTRAVQDVVRKSLADSDAQGRVTLVVARTVSSRPHPFNFYYKLGFRASENFYNNMGKEGKTMYPDAMIYMYLPKENIEHCLNYRSSFDAKSSGLKYMYDYMR